jgi:hypothetical protein
MITNNKREIVSPFKFKKPIYDISSKDHPAQEEVRKFIGQYQLVAEVKEDTDTISLLSVPGLVSFLCTLRDSEGRILSQGRGSAVLNPNNRFISKMVNLAFGSAFVDASVRCAKVLDTLRRNDHNDTAIEKENDNPELATEKQKNYLIRLLDNSGDDYEIDEINNLTKSEAAEKIGILVGSK